MTTPSADLDSLFAIVEAPEAATNPRALVEQVADELLTRQEFRALLDARLLLARIDLGLPLVSTASLAELPEPVRTDYEERYVQAIREIGRLLLDLNEIGAAWAYYRAIVEKEPVFAAIDAYQPEEFDQRIGQIIDVAFNQGVHPRKGFELILDNYGTCSAISAFESLPPDEGVRTACADRLTRRLHADLVANLRAEITRRGQPLQPEGTPIAELIRGREWLFVEEGYHLDVSHLASTVRFSTLLTDPETIRLAVGLCDYGTSLSERYQYEGEAPFENLYGDHAIYLNALLGQDVESAIEHFKGKLNPPDPDGRDEAIPAQVLVRLLDRIGRTEQALDIAATHLLYLPDSALSCPSIARLCQNLGRLDRLAEIARNRNDVVNYIAARLSLKA